jgi:hypothetical protein
MKKGNHDSVAVVPRRYSASVHCKEPDLARRVMDPYIRSASLAELRVSAAQRLEVIQVEGMSMEDVSNEACRRLDGYLSEILE